MHINNTPLYGYTVSSAFTSSCIVLTVTRSAVENFGRELDVSVSLGCVPVRIVGSYGFLCSPFELPLKQTDNRNTCVVKVRTMGLVVHVGSPFYHMAFGVELSFPSLAANAFTC